MQAATEARCCFGGVSCVTDRCWVSSPPLLKNWLSFAHNIVFCTEGPRLPKSKHSTASSSCHHLFAFSTVWFIRQQYFRPAPPTGLNTTIALGSLQFLSRQLLQKGKKLSHQSYYWGFNSVCVELKSSEAENKQRRAELFFIFFHKLYSIFFIF